MLVDRERGGVLLITAFTDRLHPEGVLFQAMLVYERMDFTR